MPCLGAHLSIAGGLWRAAVAAADLECGALQVFLRSPGRWTAPDLTDDAVARFRLAVTEAGLEGACFAHAPYLLNLASSDGSLRRTSVDALVDELVRAGRLGLSGVVLHPGSAGVTPRNEAEARCRQAIVEAVDRAGERGAKLLLEGTAGMGAQLGASVAELAGLVDPAVSGRVGVCLDTAHLWGAGYDLTGDGWERVLGEVAEHWGLAAPHLLHANDTLVALGSRKDRHAPPGDGVLGASFYRRILADRRLRCTPLVVEIPPGDGNELIRAALARLRTWQKPRQAEGRRMAG